MLTAKLSILGMLIRGNGLLYNKEDFIEFMIS